MSTVERISDEEFSLDTGNFEETINKADDLADKMSDLKNHLDELNNMLMLSWTGKGRNTFEKKYRLLSQQFGDLRDELRDFTEKLKDMEQVYLQADVDISKSLAGTDSRF